MATVAGYQVPGTKETYVQRFEKLKSLAIQARMPFEREAWLNLAFYLDEQYVRWDTKSNTICRIDRDTRAPNAPRPIVNKIMHFVQQEKALVLQAKPTVDVLPATDDLMDITDASVGKAYCTYVADPTRANWERQLGRGVMWSILAGDGYHKWVWDPVAKQVDIIPCSMFEIWTDPFASDFSKSRYIGHSKFMDVDQVKEAYGVEVKPGKEEVMDPMRASLLHGMGAAPAVSGVTVNELWHKPNSRYPDGLYAVWANGALLNGPEPQPLPYAHLRTFNMLPFTQIGCIERPDSKHFMSPVKYLRSAQMELNKYHAQRIMVREAFANPKWGIPNELNMEVMPDDSPRQILKYDSPNGQAPTILQPATYPANDDGDLIEAQMMHIVGLHEVSQGQVPGRVEAAKAIELLKESDADRQATMLETINTTITQGFYHALMLGKQFETDGTVLQTYSREGLPEVRHWKAEKIKPGMRIATTMGTGLARSRAARQDQLMNMWQNRIITDPELMAELMEVPIPSFAQPKALDMRLARNENLEIAKDVAIVPNSWDDHAIHLREHNDYRKTQEFLTAKLEIKQKFEFHCQRHSEFMDAQIAKAATQAAAMHPQTGGGSVAPPQPDVVTPDSATQVA